MDPTVRWDRTHNGAQPFAPLTQPVDPGEAGGIVVDEACAVSWVGGRLGMMDRKMR